LNLFSRKVEERFVGGREGRLGKSGKNAEEVKKQKGYRDTKKPCHFQKRAMHREGGNLGP